MSIFHETKCLDTKIGVGHLDCCRWKLMMTALRCLIIEPQTKSLNYDPH